MLHPVNIQVFQGLSAVMHQSETGLKPNKQCCGKQGVLFAQIFFCLQKNCSGKKRDEHIFLNVDIQGTGMGHNEIQPIEMWISTAHNKPLINISPDRNQSNHQQQS